MKVLVLNGINLNMFGKRDPAQYGTATLAEIDASLHALGAELGAQPLKIAGQLGGVGRARGCTFDAGLLPT